MTRHGGGSFGGSDDFGGGFDNSSSYGSHGRTGGGSFGPPHSHPPRLPPGHFPPPPLSPRRRHHNRHADPFFPPAYSMAYSPMGPRVGPDYQMPSRGEAVGRFDRRTQLLNQTKSFYTFLLVALGIVTLWLCFGLYGTTVVQLGLHDSRLLTARPYFVQTMQFKNRYEMEGPLFYEFDQRPPLNQESRWRDWQNTTFKADPPLLEHREFYYWLNKGSTVTIDYTLNQSTKLKPVFFTIVRDDPDNLKDYYSRPDYGSSIRLLEKGKFKYEATADADYAFSSATYNPTFVKVSLESHFHTREYSTASATQHSAMKTDHEMALSIFHTRYGLLVGPGRDETGIETWEIEVSYGVRWTLIVFVFALVTLAYLVTKSKIMASMHELDFALPPEYVPVAQDTPTAAALVAATAPSAPTLQTPASILDEQEQLLQEASENLSKKEKTNVPEDKFCSVCLDAPKDSFFVPCGHRATCYACGLRISEFNPANCPICRQPITDVKKIYDV